MKTRSVVSVGITAKILLVAFLFTLALAPAARAQLVADGTTAAINATSTNTTGNLVVGTNGSFTTLIITNAGTVTNTGIGVIGQNSSARTNRVIVTDASSVWSMGGNLNMGLGPYGVLMVTNGGRVENNFGNMGFNSVASTGVTAIVTGNNSVWTNRSILNIGHSGPLNRVTVTSGGTLGCGSGINIGNGGASNQLIVTSGGRVLGGGARFGLSTFSLGNLAVITDPGSQWTLTSELDVGDSSSFNQLFLTNGARILSAGVFVGAKFIQSGIGSSNLVVLAGAGSTVTNTSKSAVGDFGSFNQLIITNAAMFRTTSGSDHTLGFQVSSSNNTMLVSGTNSLFSNHGTIAQFYVGFGGTLNQLAVRDGGFVQTDAGHAGYGGTSSNNVILVADPGSTFSCFNGLNIGYSGSFNQLVVSNGGTVSTPALYLGVNATSSNNTAAVAGGNLFVTNASGTGVTDVRNGALTLHSGLLQTDRLLLTNGQWSQFSFNSGTLRTRSTSVTNNSTVLVAGNATLELLGNGTHAFAGGLQIMNNGTLAGNGTLSGMLTILGGGTLAPGSDGISPAMGKITLNNSPLWQGTIVLKLSKNGASLTNDQVLVNAPLFYGNWLVVSNLGPDTLSVGDSFQLFTATGGYSGAFALANLPALPEGLSWTNKLLVDGSIAVVETAVATPPTISSVTQSGTNLVLNVTGGSPGGAYTVLTATNVALPLANWTTNRAGLFDGSGHTTITNGIQSGDLQRYFRIRMP